MNYKKPQRLKPGDTVAVVSPSWAGPSVFPDVYENGLKILKKWGLNIKEYPTTRGLPDSSLTNVKARAKDINDAFANKVVKAIFVSIGGDDSVRIIPYLNKEIIINNPKIFMGYSDTTTMLTYFNLLGLVTFNGPTIMAGFSQMESLPDAFEQHVYDMLFTLDDNYVYPEFGVYCDGYRDWSEVGNVGKTNELKSETGMRIIQGSGKVSGQLFGGCIEVIEFLKSTEFYPSIDFWNAKVLFFETSEEKPSIQSIKWMLRNYGVQGVFEKVNAILFARARDYSNQEKIELDTMIKEVVSIEFGNTDLPIITNVEFGHSDPQIVLPNGVNIEINLDKSVLKLIENCIT